VVRISAAIEDQFSSVESCQTLSTVPVAFSFLLRSGNTELLSHQKIQAFPANISPLWLPCCSSQRCCRCNPKRSALLKDPWESLSEKLKLCWILHCLFRVIWRDYNRCFRRRQSATTFRNWTWKSRSKWIQQVPCSIPLGWDCSWSRRWSSFLALWLRRFSIIESCRTLSTFPVAFSVAFWQHRTA